MSTLVYACVTAAGMVFSDLPCDQPRAAGMSEQNARAFAAIQESPPRIPEGWGMDPIQVGSYRPRWWRGGHPIVVVPRPVGRGRR
jgi:hypothetical protein